MFSVHEFSDDIGYLKYGIPNTEIGVIENQLG